MLLTDPPSFSAVNLNTCHALKNNENPFILTLNEGENLFAGILQCADIINLQSAIITGLGALSDITIGYYHIDSQQHQSTLFSGTYELVSLTGNITFADGKRFAHIHAAIGDSDCKVFGGHIIDAFASASTEISIVPLHSAIHREYSEKYGIRLICPNRNSL